MHSAAQFIHRALAGAAFVTLAAACGTQTSTTSLWSAPVPAAGAPKSIVVVAAGVGPGDRRILEDQLTTRLSKTGVNARPSYLLFSDEAPSREEAQSALQAAGYEGVLVSRLKKVKDTQRIVPNSYDAGLWDGYYGRGGGWYGGGYIVTDQNVDFESTLWDARGSGKLLWSATTSTLNPSSSSDFASKLAKTIVPEMTKSGFLPGDK